MYDGVKAWTISTKEVLDENDKPAFSKRLMPKRDADGKVMKDRKGQPLKESVKIFIEPPVPEYELFKKTIRGDSSDNIMTAYPGAREKGSSKKPGIQEAFNDRKGKGFDWNLFMLEEWDKVVDSEADGTPIFRKVRVTDEFKINESLIDLRAQPDNIKEILDLAIVTGIQKSNNAGVGIWFLKFCNEMNLVNIAKNPNEHAAMLAAPYPKIV
jgi:hypothetical protein